MKKNNSLKIQNSDNHIIINSALIKKLKKLSIIELSIPQLPKIESFISKTNRYYSKKKLINRTRNILKNNFLKKNSLYNISKSSSKINKQNISGTLILKSNGLTPRFNYSLSDIILAKKKNYIENFHQNLMLENKISWGKNLNENYKKIKMEEKSENEKKVRDILYGNQNKMKTGIFGPKDNIISVIRAKIERLKYDQEYKNVNPELKELIKDEILDAQVKIKMKPGNLKKSDKDNQTFILKKFQKYRYLKKLNSFREINNLSCTPNMVNDGYIMTKLAKRAFECYNIKSKNEY